LAEFRTAWPLLEETVAMLEKITRNVENGWLLSGLAGAETDDQIGMFET